MKVKSALLTAGAAALLMVGMVPLSAQEPGASKPDGPPAARKADPSRRVPPFFGQVGLTPEQREKIYTIQAGHSQRIEDLERQIAAARSQMLADCEAVLTDSQRQLLEQRRRSTTRGAARSAKAPAQPTKSAD